MGTPILMASGDGDEPGEPLRIGRVDIQVTITGVLARTTTTLTFENEGDRTLEGELVFPLPEGSTVSGYGLDVDGEMVDAVVVEAQAARVAFEQEVRRGIDPGLVEWVRGNSFRTRVWPIPAHGRRTVKVEYVSELMSDALGATLYSLPLRYSLPVPQLDLRVEVLKGSVTPEIQASRLANLRFEAWQDRLVASARLRNEALSDDIRVSLPPVARESAIVERHRDGNQYFAIDDWPQFAEAVPAAPTPRRVGLLWDASLSHDPADAKRELEVVRAWLASLADTEVVLTIFRNVPEPPQTLRVHGGDPTPVLAALEREPYDGGTSLGALPVAPGVAYYVLVSDGFTNIGGGLPEKLGAPVYALTASRLADHPLLGHLARKSGGRYLQLGTVTSEDAAALIGRPPAVALSVEFDRSSVADVLPADAEPVEGRVTVTGRLLVPEARVTLRYRAVSGATSEKAFVLKRTSGAGSGLIPRLWAQRKAEQLSIFPERHHDELIALGKAFGIVTPGTSLLVLETLDQYLRHGIEPPETSGDFRAEYLRLVAERKTEETRTREAKIQRVLSMWRARVAWWEAKPTLTATGGSSVVSVGPVEPERTSPPVQAPQRIDCAGVAPMLRGRITDPSGGTIPGADITAANQDSGASFHVQSGNDGVYALCHLPPGPYTIRVELTGFKTREHRMRLPARGMPVLNLTLDVGTVAETVEVAAAPSMSLSSAVITAASAGAAASSIEIQPWDPDTPYLTALKDAGPDQGYAVYVKERSRYATSPAFFLDCADYFLRSERRAIGLRVLTGLLDLKLEDPRLLRVVAHRLRQLGELDLAIELFERVLRLRPEEPQSPRDLALALSDRGDAGRTQKRAAKQISADYLRALELLNEVGLGEWDGRFPEIEVVALMDANRLIAVMKRDRLPGIDRVALDPRLRKLLDVDVRITLTWDTDETDMDLWVTEPTGEKCDYSHNRTAIGGMVSSDFTEGYGPEEYLVRHAHPGVYKIQANFHGSQAQSLTGPTTAQATVITHFGRPNEDRQTLTLRLTDEKEVVDIGSVRFGSTAKEK
jgi:hypothetical protein